MTRWNELYQLYQLLDTQAIFVYKTESLLDLKTINKECIRSFNIPYCLDISRQHSKSKSDVNTSPYYSSEVNKSWPTGVTRIPRANTKWDESPPIEMAQSGSARAVAGSSFQTNGYVSYRLSLCCPQTYSLARR